MNTKRITIAMVILIMFFSAPLFAQSVIHDEAELLSADEKTELENLMHEISTAYNFDFIILTRKTIEGMDPIDFSWMYLDGWEKGLGGITWDGCMLLQVTRGREYAFTASGRGKEILNTAAYDKLEDAVVACLRQNNYAEAYKVFLNTWKQYLKLESRGQSYNFLQVGKTHAIWLSVAWAIALIIGASVVTIWKWRMNTVLPKTQADSYIVPGSLAFTQMSDRFLYSTVTKVKRQSSSSSSSGGGSSRSSGSRSSRSGRY